jgi:hypothetical protein
MKNGKNASMGAVTVVVSLLVLGLTPAGWAWATNAQQVLQAVEDRYVGKTSQAQAYMKLYDDKGNERSRQMTVYRAKQDGDNKDNFIHFAAPPDIRNTTYLVNERNRERAKFIYLSAFKNVRKIVASDYAMAFVSSDFTYEDMEEIRASDYVCSDLKEEEFAGEPVYVITCVKKGDDTSYAKTVMKVSKDKKAILHAAMFDKKDPAKQIKEMTASKWEKVQDIWTPHVVEMKDLRKNTRTVLETVKTTYDLELKPDLFTERNMAK